MNLWDKAVESLEAKHKQNIDFRRTEKHAILADILEEVQKKKQACIERRLKYKRKNGEVIILYKVYEKMVKWVTKFKEVGDIAMQYDPGHAALPWAAIRFFLQISVNDVQIFGILVEGLEVVCEIVARYATIERLYLRQSASLNNLLENSIIALYASILLFFSKCRKYFDLRFAQRLARSITQAPEQLASKYLEKIAVNERNVKELTRIIDAERARLSGYRQSSMIDKIDNLGSEIERLQIGSRESASRLEALLASFQGPLVRNVEHISSLTESLTHGKTESEMQEERLQILHWLSDVHYKKHHQSVCKGLLNGTGSWLIQKPQFVGWRNSSVSSVLWLHGIPGSGKTCLMSTVIRQLLVKSPACENAAPIAYFYCQRNTAEPQRSDPTEILRAVLRQLLCYVPGWQTTSSCAKEYRARESEAKKDGFEISRLDISETTDQLIEIASQKPVTILIDALDECHSDKRYALLSALDDLLERSTHLVKVFVSSRDDVDIVLRLQKHPNIYINIGDNTEDIRRFVESEIQRAQSDRRLLKGTVSPKLTELIIENLATKAEGMFLWVSLQIENLCDSRRIKIEGDLVNELTRLPRTLADMYALILENIRQIEQRGRTVAEKVFKWLICTRNASSRLTIAACSEELLTHRQSVSISDILDVCSTLVIYDEALDKFRFAHLSIREFLESQPGYTPSEANRCVLEQSLQILTRFPSLVEKPFQAYATHHWLFHYHRLNEQHRKEAFELHAKRFFFNGIYPSEFFKGWISECKLWLRKDSDNFQGSELLYLIARDLGTPDINLKGFRFGGPEFPKPVDLASCLGWLEILDHVEAGQSPDDFQVPAKRIMATAIRCGRTSVVRWLMVRNVYPTNEHVELALNSRQPGVLQMFLDKDLISLDTSVHGQEILIFTVRLGLWNLYWDLIQKGANRNSRDQHGRTILSYAVSTSDSNSGVVEDLLLAGMDPIAPDDNGITPLWYSVWGDHQFTLPSSLLVTQVPRLSEITDGKEALRQMLRSSYYHNVCLLLYDGLDSMLENEDMRAEWMELLELIVRLTGHHKYGRPSVTDGAGDISDDAEMQLAGQTLLSLAALFRHEEAFRVLLALDIDPTCPAICDIRKRTSTFARDDHSFSCQEALDEKCERGYGKMSDDLRQGPLVWAAYTGNLPLVQSILDRGLDPNIKNRKGQTALYFAVQQPEDKFTLNGLETDKVAIVKLLLQKGAVVTSLGAYGGCTLLANAFQARYNEVAKILLDNGAETPKGPINGPLLGAFHQGHEGIRQSLLMRAKSDGTDRPSSGRRFVGDPLDIAARLALGGVMRILGDVNRTV